MQATLVISRNPFHPMQGRSVCTLRRRRRVDKLAPQTTQPFICLLNGAPLLRAQWKRTTVNDGDLLAFVTLPQGGGNGGSDALRIVAMIVVLWYAPELAGYLEVPTAVVAFGGMVLVNALIPPPMPPSPQQQAAGAAPSPTYSLQAQGNYARVGAAIPVQYGRHLSYPDFAAQPYAEFVGNEQYLYQLLCIGQGAYDVESVRLEDTPTTSFEDITYELVAPGGSVTLFPTDVQTSTEVDGVELPGQTMSGFGATQSGTTITVTEPAHGRSAGSTFYGYASLSWPDPGYSDGSDLTTTIPWVARVDIPYLQLGLWGQTFTVASVVDANHYTVYEPQPRSGATGAVYIDTAASAIGPFVAVASGVQANYIGIDMVCSRGLFYANDNGSLSSKTVSFRVEAQPINNAGSPTGAWQVLGSESISAATNTPQRRSYRYAVTAARYQVRCTRTDVKDTSNRVGHDLNWAGLRAYIPGTQAYGNLTLLAMRMKANASLSQAASRKVNVTATRKLPIYSGAGWSAPTATRSIAWALADAARNADYGARLADAQIDLAALQALDATWAARGDTFDGRFDNSATFWESVTQIARAGRAKAFQQGGILRVVRDQAQSLPVAMFSPRNTVRGSLKVNYLMPTPETADCITVQYFDASTWSQQEVTAALPGSASATPARVQLFGVTSRDQAWREGMYMAACNRYRRKPMTLTTEMEGFISSFGDLVAVASERLTAAQFGEVVAWDAGTNTITTSEPLAWGAGTHYFGLRRRDGSFSGPWAATAGATAYKAVLATAPDFTPYTGQAEERTHFSFGIATEYRQLALVMSTKPRSENQVELSLVNEYIDGNGDQYVHLADTGTPPAALQPWQLPRIFKSPGTPTGVVVSETLVNLQGIVRTRMDVRWNFDPAAEGYRVAWRIGTGNWNQLAETTATTISVIDSPVATVEVRVVSYVSARESAPAYSTVVLLGKTAPPANVANFRINGNTLAWTEVADLDLAGYQLRFNYGANDWWPTATPLHEGLVASNPYTLVTQPAGMVTLMLKAVDTSGNESANAAIITLNVGDALVDNILFSQAEHTAFAGSKTYCTVSGGVLQAVATDRFFEPADEPAFSPANELAFAGGTYSNMVYEWTFDAPDDGTVLLQYSISASGFNIEYQLGDQSGAFLPGTDDAFNPADEPFFGSVTGWSTWPGAIELPALQRVYFRISLTGGDTRGQISTLTSILDVPDVVEQFNDLAVSAAGVRLPITKSFRVIQNLKLAVQADGGSGISSRIKDKNPTLGPLVEIINSAGTAVAGVLDATAQGY